MSAEIVTYLAIWYGGNILYNDSNHAAGGFFNEFKGQYSMTLSTLQLFVGFIFSLVQFMFLGGIPALTMAEIMILLPAGFCSAGAHAASVFSMALGGVAFGQVVKAAEPAFAALVGALFYGKSTPVKKILCFVPMVFGIFLCCLKPWSATGKGMVITDPLSGADYLLDANIGGLIGACIANIFAAFKAQENKKVVDGNSPEIKAINAKLGAGTGGKMNQFAIGNFISMMCSIPLVFARESAVIPTFIAKATAATEGALLINDGVLQLVLSGLAFYGYNMAVLLSLKKLDAVMQSVLNTAKRVVVIAFAIIVRGEDAPTIKIVGCTICMIGVFLYALINAQMQNAAAAKAKKA